MKLSKPDVRHVRITQILSVSAEPLAKSKEQLSLVYDVCRPAEEAGFTWGCYAAFVERLVHGPHPRLPKREAGRSAKHRLWAQLCVQDWLATHALEMLLNTDVKKYADNALLQAGKEQESISEQSVTPAFLDVILETFTQTSWNTTSMSYTSIIALDMQLRKLTKHPACEARAANRIVLNHLILLLHRKYFLASFHDDQYAYSRWTSVATARQIIACVEEGIASAEFSAWHFAVRI